MTIRALASRVNLQAGKLSTSLTGFFPPPWLFIERKSYLFSYFFPSLTSMEVELILQQHAFKSMNVHKWTAAVPHPTPLKEVASNVWDKNSSFRNSFHPQKLKPGLGKLCLQSYLVRILVLDFLQEANLTVTLLKSMISYSYTARVLPEEISSTRFWPSKPVSHCLTILFTCHHMVSIRMPKWSKSNKI